MPELPEVETVRRGLAQELEGSRISRLELRREGLRYPFPAGLSRKAAQTCIRKIRRRAKYLLFELEGDGVLIAHLGMSGKLILHPGVPGTLGKHAHAVFYFDDGRVLVFEDARRFGLLDWVSAKDLRHHRYFRELGPEPLEEAFSAVYLREKLTGKQRAVKEYLMDQRLVVGVGNIYACEALFRAGLDPRQPGGQVSEEKLEMLVNAVREVLGEAIASGGSTLRDFVRSSGDAGYFQHHFAVYGREREPCERCQTPVVRFRQGGRSSFMCPQCQPSASENKTVA